MQNTFIISKIFLFDGIRKLVRNPHTIKDKNKMHVIMKRTNVGHTQLF
jgi:hypothetical protein